MGLSSSSLQAASHSDDNKKITAFVTSAVIYVNTKATTIAQGLLVERIRINLQQNMYKQTSAFIITHVIATRNHCDNGAIVSCCNRQENLCKNKQVFNAHAAEQQENTSPKLRSAQRQCVAQPSTRSVIHFSKI